LQCCSSRSTSGHCSRRSRAHFLVLMDDSDDQRQVHIIDIPQRGHVCAARPAACVARQVAGILENPIPGWMWSLLLNRDDRSLCRRRLQKRPETVEESLRKRARPFNRDYERHSSNARRLLKTNLRDLVAHDQSHGDGIPLQKFRVARLFQGRPPRRMGWASGLLRRSTSGFFSCPGDAQY
jgi:hypothetical protein